MEQNESLVNPVDSIIGVWKFERTSIRLANSRSTPGHLFHLVESGSYHLTTNGRRYHVRSGDVIYYHESESVEWRGESCPVTFYSVAFLAPRIPPLPLDCRVFKSNEAIRICFSSLYKTTFIVDPIERCFSSHASLLDLLLKIEKLKVSLHLNNVKNEAWIHLEAIIREKRSFRPCLEDLSAWVGLSRASIVRSCRRCTGLSPMKYLRKLRMAEAVGLLHHSNLSVTQVAKYLGYPRLHEFSREFSTFHGFPPSGIRSKANDLRVINK